MCRCGRKLEVILLATLAVGQFLMGTQGRADQAPQSIHFDLYHDYIIVVEGSAGQQAGLHFLLDTGTSPSILDMRLAAMLHLQVAPTRVAVLNGSRLAGMATVTRLQLGPVYRENLPVILHDLSYLQKAIPTRIDGIIGLDLLGQSPFVIDYRSRQIRFGPPPWMQRSLPFQLRQGLPVVSAAVDGETVHLLLDTGASSLILFGQVRSLMESPVVLSRGIGEFTDRQRRLIQLQLGTTHFTQKQARVIPIQRDVGRDFDGVISPVALGMTQLAVDPGAGKLTFTLAR